MSDPGMVMAWEKIQQIQRQVEQAMPHVGMDVRVDRRGKNGPSFAAWHSGIVL